MRSVVRDGPAPRRMSAGSSRFDAGMHGRANVLLPAVAIFALSLAPSAAVHAIGLGGFEVQSSLGQRLRMVVNVTARADETVDASCFKVNPYTVASDGLPQLTSAQIALERVNGAPRLIVTSPKSINDPIVRLSIEVGCETTLRRDLTLLLDPAPSINTAAEAAGPASTPATPPQQPAATRIPAPAAGTSAAPSSAAAADTAATGAQPATVQDGTPSTATRTAAPATSGAAAPASGAAAPASASGSRAARRAERNERAKAAAAQSVARPAPRAAARATPAAPSASHEAVARAAAKASSAQGDRLSISTSGPAADTAMSAPVTPRLTLSTSLSDRTGQQPLPESVLGILRQKQARLRAAPAEEDIPSLEAELVVLQKRTAELRTQLDTVMAQMQKLSAAPAGQAAATPAAPAEPALVPATPVQSLPGTGLSQRSGPDMRWIYSAVIAILIALAVAGFLGWLRNERASRDRAERWNESPYVPATGTPAIAGASLVSGPPTTAGPAAVKKDRSPTPESYAFSPFSMGHAASQLGVSDLAQATEKASVFVTLGRPEQAIDVLRDHIDHETKPSPMAWLMLLDLYRQTGRQADFIGVADRFHQKFNAETPQWELVDGREDPGLAAFPRVIGHIRRDWPRTEALAYIENLLHDNRGGSRIGFSLSAFRDLLLLHSIVDEYLGEVTGPPRVDPMTGALISPEIPPPPHHLAKIWAECPAPPPRPVPPSLQLDVNLLANSPESCALEKGLPIVAEAIITRWGKPGTADYLTNLISLSKDDRNSDVSSEMMSELLMLQDVACALEEERSTDHLSF